MKSVSHVMNYESQTMTHLSSVSIALENLKHGLVKANSNASLSNVNLFNVFAFVSILSDGPIVVNFSLKYFWNSRMVNQLTHQFVVQLILTLTNLKIPWFCACYGNHWDTYWLAFRLFLTRFFISCSHVFAVPGIGLNWTIKITGWLALTNQMPNV